jgi:integrase
MSKQHWGEGNVYLRGNIWWFYYPVNGRMKHESSKSTDKNEAQRLRRKRILEIESGNHVGSTADKITIDALLNDLLWHYQTNNPKSHWWAKLKVRFLREFFGYMKAAKLGSDQIKAYVDARKSQGRQNGTINRELSLLRKACKLAHECEPSKLVKMPKIPELDESGTARQGFFEESTYQSLRQVLDPDIVPVLDFAYVTGCRRGEIIKLQWPQVDLEERIIRLRIGETKNDDSRLIPLTDELLESLARLKAERDEYWPDSPWVFSRQGKRIKSFKGAWEAACIKAGLPKSTIFHDLRRTGVRNLVRAGVPEKVAMTISGHKTRDVFERYNIVSEDDLHEAMHKLKQRRQRKGPARSQAIGETGKGKAQQR